MRGRKRRTKQKTQQFIEVLRQSANVSCAARAVDIGRTTAYRWRNDSAEFAVLWDEAINDAVDSLEAEAWRRAVSGTEKPVYHQGTMVGTIRQYSDTLLIFLLKGHKPDRFKDRAHVEHIKPPDLSDAKERLRKMVEAYKEKSGQAVG